MWDAATITAITTGIVAIISAIGAVIVAVHAHGVATGTTTNQTISKGDRG